MAKKQDTLVYRLKKGRETVYIGTTNDPEGRAQEHRDDGKRFDSMQMASRRMTADGAKSREEEMLGNFRDNHGKNPRYNKDRDG